MHKRILLRLPLLACLGLLGGQCGSGSAPPPGVAAVRSAPGSVGSIQNGALRINFKHAGLENDRWQAIGIESLEILDGGLPRETIPCENSPLWRIDFRELADLAGETGHNAAWRLVPRLGPRGNVRAGMPIAESNLVWADTFDAAHGPTVGFEILGDSYARLEWRNLPVDFWHPGLAGVFDVTVHVRLDPFEVKPPQLSIDVETRLEEAGEIDVAVLSVCFPDMMLTPLRIGPEPAGGQTFDDALLIPYHHGNLIPDPLRVTQIEAEANISGVAWPEDDVKFDFGEVSPNVGNQSRLWTYPGESCTQFLFYYDLDLEDPWVEVDASGSRIDGYHARPSRQGGGPGLYVAAHDPDLNVKRIVPEGRGEFLRLAIRTYLPFEDDRNRTLFDPSRAAAGERWQSYYQGPDSRAANPPSGRDIHFGWPVVLDAFEGDWLDATEHYKAFFDAESRGLLRDGNGAPVPFREMGPEYVPEAYKSLLAVIGLAEEIAGAPGSTLAIGETDGQTYREAVESLRDYLDFLRQDYETYQDTAAYSERPWYAVIHPQGMAKPSGGVGKSGGTDRTNNPPRRGYADLVGLIRQDAEGEPNQVVVAQNRDHGTWTDERANAPTENYRVKTESASDAIRREADEEGSADILFAYDRMEAGERLEELLEDSLHRFQIALRDRDIVSPEIPLDWYWISGQGSSVKPDYSFWFEPPGFSQPNPRTGGGNEWALCHEALRRSIVAEGALDPPSGAPVSRQFFLSTERLSEHLLLYNSPSGHRLVFPTPWEPNAELNPGAHLALYSEVVGITSYLFHEYTLMRGTGVTFAEFFGLRGSPHPSREDCPTLPTKPSDYAALGLFEPHRASERAKAEQLSRVLMAEVVVHLGLVPQTSVEVFKTHGPDGWPLVCDDGGEGLDSLDDRLAGNQFFMVGKDDVARFYDDAVAENPRFWRNLLRSRSRFREFYIGGRRIRDPEMVNPSPGDNPWWAEDLYVYRWNRVNFLGTPELQSGREFVEGSEAGGVSIERLIVGSYMDVRESVGAGGARVLVVVCNPYTQDVDYSLHLDATRWPLPEDETYSAVRLTVDAAVEQAGPRVTPGSREVVLRPSEAVKAGKMHHWVLQVD